MKIFRDRCSALYEPSPALEQFGGIIGHLAAFFIQVPALVPQVAAYFRYGFPAMPRFSADQAASVAAGFWRIQERDARPDGGSR